MFSSPRADLSSPRSPGSYIRPPPPLCSKLLEVPLEEELLLLLPLEEPELELESLPISLLWPTTP